MALPKMNTRLSNWKIFKIGEEITSINDYDGGIPMLAETIADEKTFDYRMEVIKHYGNRRILKTCKTEGVYVIVHISTSKLPLQILRMVSKIVNCSKCNRRAYYYLEGKETDYFCGYHCKNKNRKSLPKPSRSELEQSHNQLVKIHEETIHQNPNGKVSIQRLRMRHKPELTPNTILIFPNYRGSPYATFDCSNLSPMKLGPIDHGQPNLPVCLNLENFHQGSKCYPEEADENFLPTEVFYKNRLRFYLDPVPHRHKFGEKNIPLYFVWVDRSGKEHHLNYIESRQFYCTFYERLAVGKPEFLKIRRLLEQGYNIEICGYDGYPLEIEEIEQAYLDPSKPFGHERVLFTLLTSRDDYPWTKYKKFEF
jgi:hypothetical protein